MVLTPEQQEELKKAAKPLIEWMCNNCHPHVTCIVTQISVELLEGISSHPNITDFIKD